MSFKVIINSLCKDYSVNITKGKDLYAFLINNEFKIYLEHSENHHSFVVYAAVCDLPNESQSEIYQEILEANYFGTEIDRSTLSIDKKTGKIVLFRWFSDIETRYSEFVPNFSSFVGHLSYWRDKINNFPKHKEIIGIKSDGPEEQNILRA